MRTDSYDSELNRLAQLGMGYRGFKALIVAVELDVFSWLEKTGGRSGPLSRRTGASARRLGILLDALAAVGFVVKRGGRYRNTPFSREWLRPGGARSIVNNLRYQEFLSQGYADLAATMRADRPRQALGDLLSKRPTFVKNYILGMAEIARKPARQLAAGLDLPPGGRLLDVGGGHGIFTLALLDRNPSLRATVLDLPETLRHTRRFVNASPHRGRVAYQRGDYHKAPFGRNAFDLVLFSHVTHDEGPAENLALLRKARAALRPGGRVVIHDFMTQGDGTRPLFSALFSLHLSTYTKSGLTYNESLYRDWLRRSGFRAVRRLETGFSAHSGTVVLIAGK